MHRAAAALMLLAVVACSDRVTAPADPAAELRQALTTRNYDAALIRYMDSRPELRELRAQYDAGQRFPSFAIPTLPSNPNGSMCNALFLDLYDLSQQTDQTWITAIGVSLVTQYRSILRPDPWGALKRMFAWTIPMSAQLAAANQINANIQQDIIATYLRQYGCI